MVLVVGEAQGDDTGCKVLRMNDAMERAAARKAHNDARTALDRAERAVGDLWDALADVHRLEAYRLEGFASFTAWAQVKLDVSARQSYRYLAKVNAIVELAATTGQTTAEAAETLTLRRPAKAVAPGTPVNWGPPVKHARKFVAELVHLPRTEMPPSVRSELLALVEEIRQALGE